MKLPILAILLLAGLAACTNAMQSADYSATAASYGSAAIGTSVATVVAVPLVVSGGALAISGAAIQDVGTGSLRAGTDVLIGQTAPQMTLAPNAAPTLH